MPCMPQGHLSGVLTGNKDSRKTGAGRYPGLRNELEMCRLRGEWYIPAFSSTGGIGKNTQKGTNASDSMVWI